MSSSLFLRKAIACSCLAVALTGAGLAQGTFVTNGTEYAIAGTLPGDQAYPAVSLSTNGGFLVWEDNVTDGDGAGISALRLDSSFSGMYSPFRVNQIGAGYQERPKVALLKNGGAAFVWQGGKLGFQHIYARFLSPSNTWLTAKDVLVNTFTNNFQTSPVIATLTNGNVVVVWGSFNQASTNSFQDLYGQILSPSGQKLGGEFAINSYTPYNQRSAALAPLKTGGFVVAWVSEMQRGGPVDNFGTNAFSTANTQPSVDIYARLFDANGAVQSYEIPVNTGTDPCGTPSLAVGSDGGYMVAWSQKNLQTRNYSWDIYARPFSGTTGGASRLVNTTLYGDQYLPQVSVLGTDYLIVWTSLGQDGSREGVYGQFLRGDGTPVNGEFRVNTTTVGQQMEPAVTSDGYGEFVAVWTSFVGGTGSFDLYAQRYINANLALPAMEPPFVYVPFVLVSNIYQPQLQVSWPIQAGLPVNRYEVYVDGAATAAASVTTNVWTMTATNGLTAASTHSFQVDYVLVDGRRSPRSGATSATAWSGNNNWGGIPFDWMAYYYGSDGSTWPRANVPLIAGGPTLLQVFLSGASPLEQSTWLRLSMARSLQGYFLNWNPQPGLIYQVQISTNLSGWSNLGSPRFAAGSVDSLNVGGNNTAYYRVLRLR
jgi:hypothetical protein